MNLPRTFSPRGFKGEADVQTDRPHGSIVAHAEARRKLQIVNRQIKRARGNLPKIQKQGTPDLPPEGTAELERTFDQAQAADGIA
jgi:hypothetical protein